jgi:Ca-activated chloride channel family protein
MRRLRLLRLTRLTSGWALSLALLAAVAAHAAVSVQIVSPQEDQPIFGKTEVQVAVSSTEQVTRVEIFVNGKLVGTATQAPWTVSFEAGDQNIKREIKAVVHGASGATAAHTLVTKPVQIDDQLDLRLQQLFVTISRGASRSLDLDEGDFKVYDNGKAQQIITFGRGELPLTAVLLLDTSESMQGERIKAARRGATTFLAGLRDVDEASVVMFSDRLLRATPFVADQKVLARALEETEATGGTAVNDFLYMSLKLLEPRVGRRVVILLSDGSDVHSVVPMSEVLWKARTGQAMIYWIQLDENKHKSYVSSWRSVEENDKEYKTLVTTVEESGGRIEKINSINELEGAFKTILHELREQYVLGYYPSDMKKDGRWHEVKVDVQRGGVKARTRDGYLDF